MPVLGLTFAADLDVPFPACFSKQYRQACISHHELNSIQRVCISFAFFPSLQETYETKRKEFLGELQRKEEEMRQMFVNKVKETEAELKEKEREVGVPKICKEPKLPAGNLGLGNA